MASDKASKKDKSLKPKKEGKESKKQKVDANAGENDTEKPGAVEEVQAGDATDKKVSLPHQGVIYFQRCIRYIGHAHCAVYLHQYMEREKHRR